MRNCHSPSACGAGPTRVSLPLLVLLLLLLWLSLSLSLVVEGVGAEVRSASVYCDAALHCSVVEGTLDPEATAFGSLENHVFSTGWGTLKLQADFRVSENVQAHAAGLLEGYLMADQISDMAYNYFMNEYQQPHPPTAPQFVNWFQEQIKFRDEEIVRNTVHSADPEVRRYWELQDMLKHMVEAIPKGMELNTALNKTVPLWEIYLLNSAGDLETLNGFLNVSMHDAQLNEQGLSDCSGLVMFCQGRDLFSGQTTWRSYYAMLRTYKFYTFALAGKRYQVSFSSSPGFTTSKDDFYVTSHGLTVMETTNDVFDNSLFRFIKPQTMLSWQRAFVSNAMAADGSTWTRIFALHNSGTYNNQWMVVNNNLFSTSLTTLEPGTMYILEQIPGYVEIMDVTNVINEKGFWPSFNIPYIKKIYDLSGYPAKEAKEGDKWSYTKNPRALIFDRFGKQFQGSKCIGLTDIKTIMQYNDYQNDPLSLGDPANQIAARADLRSSKPVAFGGIDSKIHRAIEDRGTTNAEAISGPSHQSESPFSWDQNPAFANVVHRGLPDKFDFDWTYQSDAWPKE